MAIIRIKRTTGNSLPTGLTFGELAFVQGSGGTANRLYIADSAGVCVWVGAEILKSPRYWTGLTADTTVPTVSAVEARVVAGGGLTFATDLNVNIDVGKFFGKYKKGDVIPATGLTVKQVIEDALSETIRPGVAVSFSVADIPFGQTSSISYTVTPTYQIKTVGAVGAGATLEWKRSTDSGWTAYPGTLFSGTETVGVTVNAVGAPFTGVTLNAGGTSDTRAFQYRWTVRDSAGATAETTGTLSIQSYSAPTATLTATTRTVNDLLPGETDAVRERGNTYSTISATITRNRTYVPLLQWKLQYSEDGGSNWFDTNTPSAGFQTANSVSSATVTTFHTASVTATRILYRLLVIDANQQSTVSPSTVSPSQPGVSFGFRMFYGPTGSAPTTSADIRGLPGVCMSGGTNRYPNPFTLNTGTVYQNYVVAVPQGANGISLGSVIDLDASSQNLLSDYRQNISTISVTDRTGNNAQNYTVFRMTQASPYSPSHAHVVTTTGVFP